MRTNLLLQIIESCPNGGELGALPGRPRRGELLVTIDLSAAAIDERNTLRVGHRVDVFGEGKHVGHKTTPQGGAADHIQRRGICQGKMLSFSKERA
jgi:hypothetical protein